MYSGNQLNADKTKGLNGECDFIFSWSKLSDYVTAPIFCLAEAEKNDIDKGLTQVSAQIIGANHFNEQKKKMIDVVYGCMTTATEWRFLKLIDNTIIFDKQVYFMTKLPELLGVLQFIVEATKSK